MEKYAPQDSAGYHVYATLEGAVTIPEKVHAVSEIDSVGVNMLENLFIFSVLLGITRAAGLTPVKPLYPALEAFNQGKGSRTNQTRGQVTGTNARTDGTGPELSEYSNQFNKCVFRV